MKYCEKCKRIFYDNKKLCEGCSEKLRIVADDDLITMLNVGSLEKERIKIVLEDSSIAAFYEKNRRKYDISVKYCDYDMAADILMKIDALPYDYKKLTVKSVTEPQSEEDTDMPDGDVKPTDDEGEEKTEKSEEAEKAENTEKVEDTDKGEKISDENDKAVNADQDKKTVNGKDNEVKTEKISTEDNDKTVYELFGFQNLSKRKRMLTGAVLWILFAAVLFLIIAGVDMGVEFIKDLFV